jgi:hypothetical protein
MAAARRIAALAFGVVALTACAEKAEPLSGSGGELIRLEATTTPATSTPSGTAEPTTAPTDTTEPEEPVDPLTECLDWHRVKIEAGDPAVLRTWEEDLDEDLVQLVAECERIVANDPARVQAMIEENKQIDEFLRQMSRQSTTSTLSAETTTP